MEGKKLNYIERLQVLIIFVHGKTSFYVNLKIVISIKAKRK